MSFIQINFMEVTEVITVKDRKLFLEFPKKLYKKDPNWTCPLDIEIENIFDPKKNSDFSNGEAIRFLLWEEGNLIGRIAAFYNKKKATHYQLPTGGCGFFECVDKQEAADLLFNKAKEWLISKGMQAMLGPVNFGENFNYWGLLVDGFMPQGYFMPYNFKYYQQLFENYGFKNYFEQYSFHKPLSDGFPPRMLKFAEYTESRPGYSFRHLSYDSLDDFINYFVDVYNTIWSVFHDSFEPLKHDEIRNMFTESKAIIDEQLFWFAFDNDKPVGFLGVIPDVNQILRKLKNGKLSLFNKLKFLFLRKKVVTRCRAFLAGIYPDYQNTGIIAALFYQLVKTLREKPRYTEIELSWVGDYNPKMIGIYNKIGGVQKKKHITYMYQFDETLPFERFSNDFEGKLY